MFTDYFKIYHAPFFFSCCGEIFLVNFLTILKRKWAQFERKDEIMMIWDSLFAHNFYLIKKLAIIEIAEAFSQSISWGGLDRVLCIRKSEWGRKIIGKIANATEIRFWKIKFIHKVTKYIYFLSTASSTSMYIDPAIQGLYHLSLSKRKSLYSWTLLWELLFGLHNTTTRHQMSWGSKMSNIL